MAAKTKKMIKVVGYMDKVDFDYELGHAIGGERVYSSEADLRKCRPCVKECGVVQVEVVLKKIIQESDFSESIKKAKSQRDWTEEEKEAARKKMRNHFIATAAFALTTLTKEERLEAVKLAESMPNPFRKEKK